MIDFKLLAEAREYARRAGAENPFTRERIALASRHYIESSLASLEFHHKTLDDYSGETKMDRWNAKMKAELNVYDEMNSRHAVEFAEVYAREMAWEAARKEQEAARVLNRIRRGWSKLCRWLAQP